MWPILKLFDAIPGVVWAGIVLTALVACAMFAMEADNAEARMAGMRAEFEQYRRQVAEATAKAEHDARQREVALATENERIANEAQRRIDKLQARVADLQRTTGGLRDTIASLNLRPVSKDSEAITYFDEARAARELLGECASQYSDVAAQADELRDQVTGLQEYATQVCRAKE